MDKSEELKKRASSRIDVVDDQFYTTLMDELENIGTDKVRNPYFH